MQSRSWSRVGSDRLVQSRYREEGRLKDHLRGSRGYCGVVEEGLDCAEGEMVALVDGRFRMKVDKSRRRDFDHVCDPCWLRAVRAFTIYY